MVWSIPGLIVLGGFILNFAFTVTPTKTEAVFGSQDNSDPLILNQESGSAFMSDSLGLDPLEATLQQDAAPVVPSDSVIADGLSLLPAKHK